MADKEQVIQALRATLISVKGALTLKQVNRDYKELQGEWIPYKRLGYSSLEKLFLDVPGFKATQVNGEWLVDAIASQETQHIASMVARQKPSKKSNPRINYANRFPKKHGSWRKPASTIYTSCYDDQYSKQMYRAKSNVSSNNNIRYNKVSNICNNNKTNDIRGVTSTSRQSAKSTKDTLEISFSNNTKSSTANGSGHKNGKENKSETKSVSNEHKHSVSRAMSKSDVKQSVKISASQRLSQLRERLNTVDVIPLQLPAAKNDSMESSGPVTHVAPAHSLEPPPDSTSAVEKLDWTCRKLGLSQPVYKIIDMTTKRDAVPAVICSITVGTSYKTSSYPDSYPDDVLAKEAAALKLLSMIESSESAGLPTSTRSKAIACLTELVAEHEAGIWASTVPHLYRAKYGENLPSNWQELLEICPKIIKDCVVNGLLVLLPNIERPRPIQLDNIYEDTVDSELPALHFPENDYWNVFITVANSALEVWLRIIGPEFSEEFEMLLTGMSNYYEHSGTLIEKSMIIINAWYAVNLDDGGWQRAKILEIGDETATVFLGDHGDDDEVSLNCIKILEPQFRKLPAQAVLCRLEGCEELAASATGADLVHRRLPGEVLVAVPGPRPDPSDPSVPLVLYDTSTQRDLNLNKEIVHDFCIAGAFTITQKPCEVEVGCVTEEGRVWVSRAGGGALVSDALALLTSGPYRRPLPAAPAAPAPNPRTLYIVRTVHGDWVRCTIISGLDGEGTVRTQLVDSGLILRAPLSSLVPLAAFSPALNAYPHQAIQVRLSNAERAASGMVARLREMLLNTQVVCRALPAGPNAPTDLPNVELIVRTAPHQMLASVNKAIRIEYEFLQLGKTNEDTEKETINHVEALNRKKERISRTTSAGSGTTVGGGTNVSEVEKSKLYSKKQELPAPMLPAIGKCFDVYVAMAANPWNFVVQPNSTRHTLQEMMNMLQKECPKLSELDAPVSPASGELYAVYYEKDQSWYRVTVAGSVSSEMVSVYFCDYGDLALFQTCALRPIPVDVPLARSLPPQAIKARLYDVWPLHRDWSVEDCIRFQEFCVDQQFVGICKDVGKDPLNPNEPLLTLELIDTSTDEDVYLNKLLVSEGRARLGSTE